MRDVRGSLDGRRLWIGGRRHQPILLNHFVFPLILLLDLLVLASTLIMRLISYKNNHTNPVWFFSLVGLTPSQGVGRKEGPGEWPRDHRPRGGAGRCPAARARNPSGGATHRTLRSNGTGTTVASMHTVYIASLCANPYHPTTINRENYEAERGGERQSGGGGGGRTTPPKRMGRGVPGSQLKYH